MTAIVTVNKPDRKNHFSTPITSAKEPDKISPNGIAIIPKLVDKERTLPRYCSLNLS